MKFILTYEYLKDLILSNNATKKQLKKFKKMQKKDLRKLNMVS